MHVSNTELTKEKVMLLGLVRPPPRYFDKFLQMSRIFGVLKGESKALKKRDSFNCVLKGYNGSLI